jgi:hypothetical protein
LEKRDEMLLGSSIAEVTLFTGALNIDHWLHVHMFHNVVCCRPAFGSTRGRARKI